MTTQTKQAFSRKLAAKFSPFITTFVIFSLFLHAVHVTTNIHAIRERLNDPITTTAQVIQPVRSEFSPRKSTSELPNLFIYRRSRKTGSTAMVDALLPILQSYGYVPVYVVGEEASAIVRAENIKPNPRRLFIAKHNLVTKDFEPSRRAVIADTIRDGYQQITSYCRYFKGVSKCDEELVECLKSRHAIAEMLYRWSYRTKEDIDTYIDLPLSSSHPALSTTVLRTMFPNATIQFNNYNVANSTCPEMPELRKVYQDKYSMFDTQVQTLRKRMLIIAGYPIEKDRKIDGSISLTAMLDVAEELERQKYDIKDSTITSAKNPESHALLSKALRVWTIDGDKVTIKSRFS